MTINLPKGCRNNGNCDSVSNKDVLSNDCYDCNVSGDVLTCGCCNNSNKDNCNASNNASNNTQVTLCNVKTMNTKIKNDNGKLKNIDCSYSNEMIILIIVIAVIGIIFLMGVSIALYELKIYIFG